MKTLLLFISILAGLLAGAQVQVVTLNGSASSDPDGTIAKYKWTQVGTTPTVCKIANDTLAVTTVVPANGAQWVPGVYTFRLQVTDNLGASMTDDMTVTWTAPKPVVDAGVGQTITLPIATVTLKATATAALGIIKTWAWTQSGGPVTGIFSRKDTSTVIVSGLSAAGVYTFKVAVTDNFGQASVDSMQVTVKAANVVPRSDAGPDQTITLPLQAVALGGFDTPPKGAAIAWRKLRGGTATIVDPTASFTKVIYLQKGSYLFEKAVTSGDLTARDVVAVTVRGRCSWFASHFLGCKG